MDIKITKFKKEYFEEVQSLFKKTLYDSFKKQNILSETQDLKLLTIEKEKMLNDFLNKSSKIKNIFVAKYNDKIVGVIALTELCQIIKNNFKNKISDNDIEISSLYILPEYQSRGIGKKLTQYSVSYLKEKSSVENFFVYSGFTKAQEFWTNFLGKPTLILENYYDNNDNCCIWGIKT